MVDASMLKESTAYGLCQSEVCLSNGGRGGGGSFWGCLRTGQPTHPPTHPS